MFHPSKRHRAFRIWYKFLSARFLFPKKREKKGRKKAFIAWRRVFRILSFPSVPFFSSPFSSIPRVSGQVTKRKVIRCYSRGKGSARTDREKKRLRGVVAGHSARLKIAGHCNEIYPLLSTFDVSLADHDLPARSWFSLTNKSMEETGSLARVELNWKEEERNR